METVLSIEPSLDKTVSVNAPGWSNSVVIHYSVELYSNVSYLCWTIENTGHIFKIPSSIVYENHGIKYSEHFLATMKVFREDFFMWKEQGFPEDWMKRYEKLYQNLIK